MMTPGNSNLANASVSKTAPEAPASSLDGGEGRRRPPVWLVVYTIIDRGNNKKVWLRVGLAFVNRDGSLTVRLDAVPINGQLHIREPLSRDTRDLGGDLFPPERELRSPWRD
jgi:hypothetical protein